MGTTGQNLIGKRVREARAKAELTQARLSQKLASQGVSVDRAGIAKIETGIRGVLDFELVALAKVLNVSAAWLLGQRE